MLVPGLMKFLMKHSVYISNLNYRRILVRQKKTMPPVSQLMVPLPVKSVLDGSNVGAELTGKLNKEEIMKWLAKFYQRREIKAAAVENGIDSMCLLCHKYFCVMKTKQKCIIFRLHLPSDISQFQKVLS